MAGRISVHMSDDGLGLACAMILTSADDGATSLGAIVTCGLCG